MKTGSCPPRAVGHVADRVHPRGQAVLRLALRERREGVEVDVEVALEDGAEPSGELRAARFLAGRQLEIAGRALEVALAGREIDHGAGGGAGRVGRFGDGSGGGARVGTGVAGRARAGKAGSIWASEPRSRGASVVERRRATRTNRGASRWRMRAIQHGGRRAVKATPAPVRCA